MSIGLDGQILFDREGLEIEVGSLGRASVERAVSGLDGVLSIDLGGRGRQIKQRGILRAKSEAQMEARIGAISAFMDGDTHKLVTSNGGQFDDVRMDVFKVSKARTGGVAVMVDYEIVYTQLKV